MTRPTIPWENNITLLRLLLAGVVVLAHAFALSGAPELVLLGTYADANLAVQGFFVLSGFLVVMSYEHSRGMRDYAAKRARRIYPAYLTVVLGCALLGALVSDLPPAEYFNAQWLRYVLANLVFLNFLAPELPGVFAGNPLAAVNGALWTIKLEVMFYLAVPVLVWLLRGRRRLPLMLLVYAASLAYSWYCTRLAAQTGNALYHELGRQLPGQMAFFITGVALYYYFDWVMARRQWLITAAIVALVCMRPLGNDWLYPAAVGMLVVAIGFGPYLGNLSRYGDYSYGIYIWHFPLIQLLVSLGLYAYDPLLALGVTVLAVAALACLSWLRVEKPWLRPSSHYVAATKE